MINLVNASNNKFVLDILFVHPNASKAIYQELSKKHSAIEPPIWAAMLANATRNNGYSTSILDCEALGLDYISAANEIINIKAKVVCFVVYGQQPSASSQNMLGACALADELKNLDPEIFILFVGGHVAALPKETLSKESSINAVCQNEGVYSILNLLKCSNLFDDNILKKVKGITFRSNENHEEIITNDSEIIVPKKNLEQDLPGMAWDMLPSFDHYRTAGWHSWSNNTERAPFAALYTSLGCPYKCTFCMINIINRVDNEDGITSENSNSFRWWSPDFIIKQFDYFAENNVKNVKIADELFVLNPNHFMKICDLIIERKYDFNIWAYSRIDTCKPKFLEKLKKAGVNWLGLGIENPSDKLRSIIHKDSFQEVRIDKVIQEIKNADINVGGNYIFGLPHDTKESMENTLQFAKENKTEMVNFYCAMAYPGSPLHKEAREKNIKLPEEYVGYSQHSYEMMNLSTKNLTSAEICKFRDQAFIDYNSDEEYLKLLEKKFGIIAREDMQNTLKISLKRKILGDLPN